MEDLTQRNPVTDDETGEGKPDPMSHEEPLEGSEVNFKVPIESGNVQESGTDEESSEDESELPRVSTPTRHDFPRGAMLEPPLGFSTIGRTPRMGTFGTMRPEVAPPSFPDDVAPWNRHLQIGASHSEGVGLKRLEDEVQMRIRSLEMRTTRAVQGIKEEVSGQREQVEGLRVSVDRSRQQLVN